MKRDLDLIREILLWIEDNLPPLGAHPDFEIANVSDQAASYHLMLLVNGGYVNGTNVTTKDSFCEEYIPSNLTDKGHHLLESIRDPEIWKQTKAGAQKVGGFSLKLFGELAEGFIKTQIKKQTGVEL